MGEVKGAMILPGRTIYSWELQKVWHCQCFELYSCWHWLVYFGRQVEQRLLPWWHTLFPALETCQEHCQGCLQKYQIKCHIKSNQYLQTFVQKVLVFAGLCYICTVGVVVVNTRREVVGVDKVSLDWSPQTGPKTVTRRHYWGDQTFSCRWKPALNCNHQNIVHCYTVTIVVILIYLNCTSWFL